MSNIERATLVADYLGSGHQITQCPARYAMGALRMAVKHIVAGGNSLAELEKRFAYADNDHLV